MPTDEQVAAAVDLAAMYDDITVGPTHVSGNGNGKKPADRELEPQATPEAHKPAPLGEAAYHGPLGAFVRAWAPNIEADPAALLATVLVGFGSIVGPESHVRISSDRHPARLWACITGASSAARKGMSQGPVTAFLAEVDPRWNAECRASGLSTGEGLIYHVRDQVETTTTDKKTKAVETLITDPGAKDKRLWLHEAEFARVLTVMARKDNTLSAVLRGLWDSGEARVMSRTTAVSARGAHVCIVAHITMEELRRALTDCDAANGFANRFLWVYAERHGSLPFGGQADPAALRPLVKQLSTAVVQAPPGEVGWSDEARTLWVARYEGLLRCGGGLTGSIIARGQPQVLRLALTYALADSAVQIERVHLEAALEVWRYSADSARYLFGQRTGERMADRILSALRAAGTMTVGDVHRIFGDHKASNAKADAALQMLQEQGLARMAREKGSGERTAERWTAC